VQIWKGHEFKDSGEQALSRLGLEAGLGTSALETEPPISLNS
jgi:hypothetical protein